MHSNDPYASGEGGGSRGGAVVWACRQVLIWGGLAAVLYLAIGYRSLVLPSGQPPASPSAAAPRDTAAPAPADANTNTQTYRADRNGHVVLEAAVNGAPVRFLVDTGATMVALTPADAVAAGISRSSLSFTGRASTANGVVRVAPVTLREVRLGQFSVENVSAAVVENLQTSLLGMSFLKRVQSYEMRDGALTIAW